MKIYKSWLADWKLSVIICRQQAEDGRRWMEDGGWKTVDSGRQIVDGCMVS